MEEFLALTLSLPTAVYTVLVLASLMYWMVSFVGLVGLDSGDGHADVGDADVGDVDAAGHGHAHGSADSAGGVLDAISGLLSVLRLRHAPLSVTVQGPEVTLNVGDAVLRCASTSAQMGESLPGVWIILHLEEQMEKLSQSW